MSRENYKGQVVWIVGCSSGIGLSLARELAARGAILALSGRRKDELEKLNAELGLRHKVFPLDVADADMTLRTAQAIRAAFERIDRIVFLAAAYAPMQLDNIDRVVCKEIVDVNLNGAFNIVSAALSVLKTQKSGGQIALCGSVAGYVGLPGGQPYSATKAAVINLTESLHAECKGLIDVKLISPGFVRTPLTDKNNFAMPMIIEPDRAAKEIADGLLSRRFEIHFPKKFTILLKILRLFPYALSLRITQNLKT